MKPEKSWIHKWSKTAQLQGENLPLQPILELCGDSRVLIENHTGVTVYEPQRIQVRVRFGELAVIGSNLRLCRMLDHQLVIQGRIEEILVIRGKK